jgi:hypothetical protein
MCTRFAVQTVPDDWFKLGTSRIKARTHERGTVGSGTNAGSHVRWSGGGNVEEGLAVVVVVVVVVVVAVVAGVVVVVTVVVMEGEVDEGEEDTDAVTGVTKPEVEVTGEGVGVGRRGRQTERRRQGNGSRATEARGTFLVVLILGTQVFIPGFVTK